METKLRNLLDLIYELEGLLHLSLKRDEFKDEILRLIVKKGKEVSELTDSLVVPRKKEDPLPFDLNEYFLADDSENGMNEEKVAVNETMEEEVSVKPDPGHSHLTDSIDRGKLVFSINDKFRFRKELFENSDVDFNNSLALVASMDDFEEAEFYFINDVGLNPTDPTVRDFLDIVKRYFA